MSVSDALLIVGISLFTAFLGEGVTYLMVYRTEKYQKLKVEIEKQTKKCKCVKIFQVINWIINITLNFSVTVEKRKEVLGEALDKQQKKKIERDEERLKNNNRDFSLVKMKSM